MLFLATFQNSQAQIQNNFVTILVQVSADRWVSHGIGGHFSYGFSGFVSPIESFRIGVSAKFSNPTADYDLVGLSESESIRLSAYQVLLVLPLHKFDSGFELDALGGAGFTILSTPEQSISAGGIGTLKIPARSERVNMYSVGLVISKNFTERISANLSPKAVFISPVRISSIGLSIEGGLAIGLF
jgi:hypothetical protein